jgi:hypothetical protein
LSDYTAGNTLVYYHDLPMVARWYKEGEHFGCCFFVDADVESDYNGYCLDGHLRASGIYYNCVKLVKEAIS